MLGDMEERPALPGSHAHELAVALYEKAFPPEERFAIDVLDNLSKRAEVDFTAYYRDGTFCGFSYCIDTGSYLYLLFLAVDGAMRSQGCGSRILARLKARYPGRVIMLEIEPVAEDAPNAPQRVKRLKFYRRNDFEPAGFDSIEGDMVYTVLVTAGPFDPDGFTRDVSRITDGAIPLELKPVSDTGCKVG